jgi:hypothetical protein
MELFIGTLIIVVIAGLSWSAVAIADMMTRDEEGYPKP